MSEPMDVSLLEDEILRYIREEFEFIDAEITRDSKLVRTGLLDSANLVQLAMHIERTFGFTIGAAVLR